LLFLLLHPLPVGINYAMNRLFPTKEYHLIYDSGALSTSASLISFHTYPVVPPSPLLANNKRSKSKVLPKPVNTTHIEVLGLGFDRQLGGTFLDEMIKDMIVREFEEKVGLKIEGGEREKALAKVWKEAGRVKSVLSANSDSAVTVCPASACSQNGTRDKGS
jgi:hypoxia up-regulated 1